VPGVWTLNDDVFRDLPGLLLGRARPQPSVPGLVSHLTAWPGGGCYTCQPTIQERPCTRHVAQADAVQGIGASAPRQGSDRFDWATDQGDSHENECGRKKRGPSQASRPARRRVLAAADDGSAARTAPTPPDVGRGAGSGRAHEPAEGGYFGEQHLHTAYSLDAYIGGARLTPSDAYRFAKGEEVEVGGTKVRLRAPLDWAASPTTRVHRRDVLDLERRRPGSDNEQVKQLRAHVA